MIRPSWLYLVLFVINILIKELIFNVDLFSGYLQHYLQLHFYRSQFYNFTQQQHRDEEAISADVTVEEEPEETLEKSTTGNIEKISIS